MAHILYLIILKSCHFSCLISMCHITRINLISPLLTSYIRSWHHIQWYLGIFALHITCLRNDRRKLLWLKIVTSEKSVIENCWVWLWSHIMKLHYHGVSYTVIYIELIQLIEHVYWFNSVALIIYNLHLAHST